MSKFNSFKIVCSFIFVFLGSTYAFASEVKNEEKFITQAQACVQALNQQELEKFQVRSLNLYKEIKRLCLLGHRNDAQNLAYNIAHDIQKSKTLLALKICNGLSPTYEHVSQKLVVNFNLSRLRFKHVCDSEFSEKEEL